MLTSSANHYLRTEYLSPIQGNNIELDAKKSPLALLAQTCSLIGADLSQKSNSLANVDKSSFKGKSTPDDKVSPSSSSFASNDRKSESISAPFKPYEKKKSGEKEGRIHSPFNKRSMAGTRSPASRSPEQPRSASRGGESDGEKTPLNVLDLPEAMPRDLLPLSSGTISRSSPHTPKPSIGSHNIASLVDLSKDPLAAYKLTPSLYSPLGLCLDPLGAAGLSSLTSKVATNSPLSVSSMSSPYIGYARVKTATGNEVILPVCRDPYCTGCQINTHALQVVNGTCALGCAQCTQMAAHTKTLSSLPSSLISSIPASSLGSMYSPSAGLLSGAHHPYVCNWIAGDTYCGKRFSSSEELLQHLRSHTSFAATEAPPLPLSSLHQHPLLSAHSSLTRNYPTPPLSPLSAAARYHPYAKAQLSHLPPATSLSSALSFSALAPHPLSAYYNPYSFYARATVGLHP